MLTNIDELKGRVESARVRANRARAEANRLSRALADSDRKLRAQRLLAIGAIAFRISEADAEFRAAILADINSRGLRDTDRAALAGTIFEAAS